MPVRTVAAWLGLGAQVVFTAYWLVAPLWQGPRYSPIAHSISDMYAVTAPAGWVMVAVLALCGAATLVFVLAVLLPAVRPDGWPGVVGSMLLALSIFGIGDLLTPFERLACRMADPGCSAADQVANAGGMLDSTISTIGVVLLIVAGFFLFTAIRSQPVWRGVAVPVVVLSTILAMVFVIDAIGPAGLGGLLERMLAFAGAVLIGLLAVTALRASQRTTA